MIFQSIYLIFNNFSILTGADFDLIFDEMNVIYQSLSELETISNRNLERLNSISLPAIRLTNDWGDIDTMNGAIKIYKRYLTEIYTVADRLSLQIEEYDDENQYEDVLFRLLCRVAAINWDIRNREYDEFLGHHNKSQPIDIVEDAEKIYHKFIGKSIKDIHLLIKIIQELKDVLGQ